MRSIVLALPILLLSPPAVAVTCDGTELLCLDLTGSGLVTSNGGSVVGGSFSDAGFAPSNNGGIDFAFPASVDLSDGAIEFDIQGLQPLPGGETSGGKVSLFSVCGESPDDNEYIGFQKMSPDYRDGHVIRFGQDDDGLADNWDAVVITSSEFGCAFNIQTWTAAQTHHVYAEWDPSGIYLEIDGVAPCTHMGGGNGDAFDPADSFLVVGNRCEHQSNQQPLASIRNLRVWGDEATVGDDDDDDDDDGGDDDDSEDPCVGPIITSGGVTPDAEAGSAVTFQARYGHCEGAETFRVVQFMVAEDVTATDPNIHVGFGDGVLGHNGDQCLPGADQVLPGEWGDLDCAASGVWFAGNELIVDYALILHPDTFGGPKNLYFDAKGGDADPEPRLGWTQVGTWTVAADPPPDDPPADDDDAAEDVDNDDAVEDDPAHDDDAAWAEGDDPAAAGGPAGADGFGCGGQCDGSGAGRAGGLGLLLLLLVQHRPRRRRDV